MTQKILGPEGSKRRKRFWLVPMLAALFAVVFFVAGATGEPGGPPNSPRIFELDASLDPASTSPPNAAVTDNATSGLPDDWDRVCKTATAGTASPQCTGAANDHAIARSFDSETTATGSADQRTIFTTGGSKDQGALSGWKWKDNAGGLPDKDNLLHAMAARYEGNATPKSSYIFFAGDRFDNSGDAQIGFWFFRTQVCTKADGTFGNVLSGGVCSGTAVHSAGQVPHSGTNAGDILILSDFTNGGTQPTIRIFEWVGSGGSDGELNLLNPTVGGVAEVRDCGTVATDDFCGSVNNFDGSVAPWLFLNKSGQNTFGHGEFYEGGLNLNRFGLQNECFSSFLAETRSSQSVTATLKDFVLGSFQQCSATLSTAPSPGAGGTVTPGTIVTDTATVTGQGGQNPPNPTGSVSFYICGPIATGTCSSTTTQVGVAKPLSATNPATAVSDGFDTTGKTPGRYCFYATWPGDTNYPGQLTHSGTGDSECFTIAKIPTGTVTTPVDGSGASKTAINLGESIFDKAVVTGTSVGGDPTGTVKFFVCKLASGTCDGTINVGTQVGAPPEGETLVSDGVAGTFTSNATSDAFTPTSTGRYCFRAEYGGSTVYIASSDSAATECFTVGPLTTTTVTTPVNASGGAITTILLTQSIYDKAVVTGAAAGGDPTGTVKFFVCKLASGTCDGTINVGTQVGAPPEGETLVSDGVAGTYTSNATSDAFTPTSVGRYCFRAEYGGDGNYTSSSDSATTECFTVTDTTGATSAQTWRPNDSATITSAGGAPLNGTLSFTLYEGLTCSGTILRAAQSFTLTNEVSPATRTTTNTTVDVDVTKNVSWNVVFTSSDPNVGSSSHCETTSLTITN